MGQGWLIGFNKCATLAWDVDSGGGCIWGGWYMGEVPVLSAQFCWEPEVTQK